ncbi:PLP-dependent transferase [Saccharata proteae CBS 121410]|uniref:Molybdenum cofactor sulfurase n=1 Tax=Saccharata proteae CBS 121410 TaxID=1314787 RepID=A0A9P4HZE7_9PEZI|nr:PLP-dependent transferase [Saccharata proteae CBS 121410]
MSEDSHTAYNARVEAIRQHEYPMLKVDQVYLDHAGTALYPKSLIERFSQDMISNLYGNPHSTSSSSQLSGRRVDDARLRLLRLFNADPQDFDVVFVANATAGIKLVMEAFRDRSHGFSYGYHCDSHTSLVGMRETALTYRCFASDAEVENWIGDEFAAREAAKTDMLDLFAYPAQSNMNGRRLPLDWSAKLRSRKNTTHTLLDAAAHVSTAPLDFSDEASAPDFTCLSLYKIFGFPDIGALIVRKAAGHVFQHRRYFGGGTVDMVVACSGSTALQRTRRGSQLDHARKSETLHDQLEDGTLPIHSIMALHSAIDVHQELFGTLEEISKNTAILCRKLYDGLSSLHHWNGTRVCEIYTAQSDYGNPKVQGPILAFNIRNGEGVWASTTEVERLAAIKGIHLRVGSLCNPGGTAASLDLSPWEMRRNFSAGQRCGSENDIMGGKPTGMIRVSLGAMSTLKDIAKFLEFMREFFVESAAPSPSSLPQLRSPLPQAPFYVESLTVYPIKSCAGWKIPPGKPWAIRKEGLAWDREWCLVHQGTGVALSQKRYPRMALLRPSIDLEAGLLRIQYAGDSPTMPLEDISVPLSANPSCFVRSDGFGSASTRVCGDMVAAQRYSSIAIANFFSQALGVACQLARFPAAGATAASARHSKAHLQQHQARTNPQMPGAFPDESAAWPGELAAVRPILLSNESPILTISRSSLNRLNEQIKVNGGKAVEAEVFRANIVVAEDPLSRPGSEQPYIEDQWRYLRIGNQYFQMLGSCRRCQMVCIDQATAVRGEEPFVTLAKTRRFDGKVFFGQHTCHLPLADGSSEAAYPTVATGDPMVPYFDDFDALDEPLKRALRR